jgi:hypothetical protein
MKIETNNPDPRERRRSRVTYFAVVHPASLSGYALDAYPEERLKYLHQWRGERARVLGEFATYDEAHSCLESFLRKRVAALRGKQ